LKTIFAVSPYEQAKSADSQKVIVAAIAIAAAVFGSLVVLVCYKVRVARSRSDVLNIGVGVYEMRSTNLETLDL